MRNFPVPADGTYNLQEVAPIAGLPESTLYRYRVYGALLTTYDYLCDEVMGRRISEADARGGPVRGSMPPARFTLEDVTRLLVVGQLSLQGWDTRRLLQILGSPRALPLATKRDGYTPLDPRNMPGYGMIFVKDRRLHWEAFDVFEEVAEALLLYPLATVVHLDSMRDHARRELAKVELEREKRAVRNAARKAERKLA